MAKNWLAQHDESENKNGFLMPSVQADDHSGALNDEGTKKEPCVREKLFNFYFKPINF